jgi:hypothetical protein
MRNFFLWRKGVERVIDSKPSGYRANALFRSLKRRAGESGVAAALCHRTPKCSFAARCYCPFCGYRFFENALN